MYNYNFSFKKSAAVHLARHCSGSRAERIYMDWMWWILQLLPFQHLVRVMDCFLHEGIKVFTKFEWDQLETFMFSFIASFHDTLKKYYWHWFKTRKKLKICIIWNTFPRIVWMINANVDYMPVKNQMRAFLYVDSS